MKKFENWTDGDLKAEAKRVCEERNALAEKCRKLYEPTRELNEKLTRQALDIVNEQSRRKPKRGGGSLRCWWCNSEKFLNDTSIRFCSTECGRKYAAACREKEICACGCGMTLAPPGSNEWCSSCGKAGKMGEKCHFCHAISRRTAWLQS